MDHTTTFLNSNIDWDSSQKKIDENSLEALAVINSHLFIDAVQIVGFFTSAEVAERICEAVQAERTMFQRGLIPGFSKLPVSQEQ